MSTEPAPVYYRLDLANFSDDAEFLGLYRKLCLHVYYTYPEIAGEHVALFRALFVNSEDSEGDS